MFYTDQGQHLISPEDYSLLLSCAPLIPYLEPITFELRAKITEMVSSENIEYRYINGSCEDRAHYICLLLRKEGIFTGKIWNFAPARFSLLSDELFNISDPFGISEATNWGYHVAPYFTSYDEAGNIETLVIDQSFEAKGFLKKEAWLGKMNCPKSLYLLTEIDNYLFNSFDGFVEENTNNRLGQYYPPTYLPSTITGNFWNLNVGDDYVQRGLAINDLALRIHEGKDGFQTEEWVFLKQLLGNFDWLVNYTFLPKPQELSDQTNDALMQYYNERYSHWSNRLWELFN
ncbi:protein-glutamine glutaminase family protein [Arcticibacterium luteifluviistationis]|uniref:Protein glutaminase domain-containing protein n=1 Tax=Arcticibacterium luteifluviistationis TaxID=1784714 RepID=A0A2Z4GE22_9BACT|nr:protein-glutamine glutaminase family protein [Arcticibacterium luteifluviistationis]AWV99153.1 hypothetical protein DJ013_13645 [Arcticibacterium luteifluviistationis]